MIFYLSSYKIGELIKEIISDNNLIILNSIEAEKINLEHSIKQKTTILETASIIIIHLAVLDNTDQEVILQLNNIRYMYQARIIVIAEDLNNKSLLSSIFELGIYDIIVSNEYSIAEEENEVNMTLLKQKIKKAIITGYTYAESSKYRLKEEGAKPQVKEKEKIIIKKEVLNNVQKAMIGFMGTQERIGTTHNAILSAYFLKKQGYKVAVVESDFVINKCYEKIQEYTNDVIIHSDFFEINGVDFYKDYNISELHKLLIKNYNFVIIDFGLFESKKLIEFNRCIISIIVSGSKAWEMENIFQIFDYATEEELKNYTYLFSFTDQDAAKSVIENMEELDKVYFTDYLPNIYESPDSNTYAKIFSKYMKEEREKPKGFLIRLYDKVKKKK